MHSIPRSRAELRRQIHPNCSGNILSNVDDAQVTIPTHEYNRLIRLDTQHWCLHEPYCCRDHRAAPYWCRFCMSARVFPNIHPVCNIGSSVCNVTSNMCNPPACNPISNVYCNAPTTCVPRHCFP